MSLFFFHFDQRWLKLIKTICPICHHDKAFHQLWPRCVSNTTSDLTVHRLHFNHYKGFVSETFILVDSTSIVTIAFLPVMHKALAKLCSHMRIIVNVFSDMIKGIHTTNILPMVTKRLFSKDKWLTFFLSLYSWN